MNYYDNRQTHNGGSIGFVGLLQLAFIILKITGLITWSWVWVLSPIWITTATIACVLLCIVIWAFWDTHQDNISTRSKK